ncbi:MAG: hypothetical protein V4527_18950 [Pseudomonadota bacterium]
MTTAYDANYVVTLPDNSVAYYRSAINANAAARVNGGVVSDVAEEVPPSTYEEGFYAQAEKTPANALACHDAGCVAAAFGKLLSELAVA